MSATQFHNPSGISNDNNPKTRELPCAASFTGAPGDWLAINTSGQVTQFKASATSNTDSGSGDRVIGRLVTNCPTALSANTPVAFLPVVKGRQWRMHAVLNSGNAGITTGQAAYVGDFAALRRVESDSPTTSDSMQVLANRYAVVADLATNPVFQIVKFEDNVYSTVVVEVVEAAAHYL